MLDRSSTLLLAVDDTRLFVYATRGIPPGGRGADMLKESCNFHVWEGNSFMPRHEMLEAVRGAEGLLVHPPDRVDRKLLDAAGVEIKKSVIGIAGFGRIGFTTAKRLKAFEPSKILYWDVGTLEYAKEIGAEFASFEELLQNSDILIVSVSLANGTKGLFDAEAFNKMKPSAIFINTSRGAVVNQDDLYTALMTGQIRAAGLDVTTPEPLPRDSPLLSLPNCTISPHMPAASENTRYAIAELTTRNIIARLKGKTLPASVFRNILELLSRLANTLV